MTTVETKSTPLITYCRSTTASRTTVRLSHVQFLHDLSSSSRPIQTCTTIWAQALMMLRKSQRLSKTSSNQEMNDSCRTFAPSLLSCLAIHVDSFHKATHNAGAAMHSSVDSLLCLARTPFVSLFTADSRELTMGIQSETFSECDRSRAGMLQA